MMDKDDMLAAENFMFNPYNKHNLRKCTTEKLKINSKIGMNFIDFTNLPR